MADIAFEWLAHERDSGALLGKPVVYVPGNHEFYNHEMKSELARGQAAADEAGIHMLNRRAVVIEGVRFLGAILWTDYRLLGTPKASMITAGDEMNDHRLIRYREDSGHIARFMPWHAAAEHRIDRDYLRGAARVSSRRAHGGRDPSCAAPRLGAATAPG